MTAPTGHTDVAPIAAGFVLVDTGGWLWIRTVGAPRRGRVVITKHGHPAAVVISVDDLESLEETLDVMDSVALLADIRESLAELSTTDATVLSKDDALRLISGQ